MVLGVNRITKTKSILKVLIFFIYKNDLTLDLDKN